MALSPLGIWGVHRRLLAQGWHVPVLGGADRDGAIGLLVTLAGCDAEDGESEISAWLVGRTEEQAAAELIAAAAEGSPGLRGAAFAVLDRIGAAAVGEVRAALDQPLLRAHAAVWLHEHGEQAELGPADRTWLLVDLGAGLLEEADPRDVVAELLPDVPPAAQAEIVAGPVAGRPSWRHRPADDPQREPSGSGRRPRGQESGLQGPIARGRPALAGSVRLIR